MDFFEFTNDASNEDLTSTPDFCLDVDVEMTPFTEIDFQGRLLCSCISS